eukprot:TRINITY_DN178_c0_g1_i12.p1 TRINITY_DN178_c0_g1~~TRINITY_DN178_c0_g1_i12.p1  ORF type:complete len:185 (+),score=44.27 TRINITY_DN178_c0_g1_i12:77-556(+)
MLRSLVGSEMCIRDRRRGTFLYYCRSFLQPRNTNRKLFYLLLGLLAETTDGGADSVGVGGAKGVSSAGNGLLARVATPDSDGLTLEGELSAERAEMLALLGDEELLRALTGVSSVTGSILSHHSHLLGALGHLRSIKYRDPVLCVDTCLLYTSPSPRDS